MSGEDDAVRQRVLAEWTTFLQRTLRELRSFAERKARNCGLGAGHGDDLVSEMTATLFGIWERLAVIVEDEERRKFAYGVLGNVLRQRLDTERRSVPRVPLPAEDLLPADVRRVTDAADQYLSGEAGEAYRVAMQELDGQQRLAIDALLDVEPGGTRRTHREIAALLGVRERQVGRLLHSAQAQLLASMNAAGYDFSDIRESAR